MKNKGKVEHIYDDCVIVKVVRQGACGDNCASCSGCSNRSMSVEVRCDHNVDIGDLVEIESNSKYIFLTMAIVFILPLVVPMLIYLFTYNLNSNLSYILSLITFVFLLVFIYFLSRSKRFLKKIKPVVTKVIAKK